MATDDKVPFGRAKYSRIKNVRYLGAEDAFQIEFEDGQTVTEPHATIRAANKISPEAKFNRLEIEDWTRSGFIGYYDNGQTAEVSWSFVRELPPGAEDTQLPRRTSRSRQEAKHDGAIEGEALKGSPLDKYQRAFCAATDRALRLLAPAGSGKTYSLLWRCLNQAEVSRDKPRFLIFAFTRAAKEELRDRIKSDSIFRSLAPSVEITTLNSWGYRRLKSRTHNLRLLTKSGDRYWFVHNNLQPVWQKYDRVRDALTSTKAKHRAANTMLQVFDNLKALGFRHDKHTKWEPFLEHAKWIASRGLHVHLLAILKILQDVEILPITHGDDQLVLLHKHFMGFWAEACAQMFGMATITLEDQKYWACIELEEVIRERRFTSGIHRFQHVLVDEFQDINTLDLNFLKAVAAINKSELTIAGDDDQAIYEWRGASPEFILKPEEHLGSRYSTFILELNYRSPSNVVELSQRLIKNNKRRVDKQVRAVSKIKADIQALHMPSLSASVAFVIGEVQGLLQNPAIKKVAIIGRKRSQIIPYQIAFASQNIPFYAAEDLHVFLSEAFTELKDILSIKARASLGPLPGFDPTADLLKLCDKVKRFPLNKNDRQHLNQHLQRERARTITGTVDVLRRYTGPLKGTNEDGRMAQNFADAVQALLQAQTVSESINAISTNFDGLQKDYGKAVDDIFYADPPFLFLSDYAQRYGNNYNAFYEDIEKTIATLARIPSEEEVEQKSEETWKLPLHLMTALRAKGKEFDAVIILDANRDIWPSKLADSEQQLEQERRVFYVGFTRARKKLTLLVNESLLGHPAFPSPYLEEMGITIQEK